MQSESRTTVDTASIASAVRAQLGEPVVSVDELNGFVGNRDFLVRTARHGYVLKTGSASGIGAEAWACARVRAEGVPAPEVVAVDLECNLLPRAFFVMREVPGGPVEADAAAVLTAVGRELRVVHSLAMDGYGYLFDRAAVPGGDPNKDPQGPWESWAEVIERPVAALDPLVDDSIVSSTLAERLRTTLEAYRSEIAYDSQARLLHADLHPRHFFAIDGRLTSIIDWGDVAVGDPLYDLGRFSRAGRTALDHVLRGYELGVDRDQFEVRITLYRVIWSLQAIVWERQAGGTWFAAHLAALADGLDLLPN